MKITFDHEEIDQALIDFARKQGVNVSAGDIEIKVQDGRISASIATRFLTAVDPATPDAENPKSTCCKPPVAVTHEEDADREVMKAQLNKLGIEYAPKARTATLQSLLEEAQAAAPVFPPEPDPQQSLPFDIEPPPTTPKVEEPDDDKPLFGV